MQTYDVEYIFLIILYHTALYNIYYIIYIYVYNIYFVYTDHVQSPVPLQDLPIAAMAILTFLTGISG